MHWYIFFKTTGFAYSHSLPVCCVSNDREVIIEVTAGSYQLTNQPFNLSTIQLCHPEPVEGSTIQLNPTVITIICMRIIFIIAVAAFCFLQTGF